jgi:hypothetical protein
MSKKYLKELVEFAQVEMPALNSDLQNASTLYALQATTQRLFNVCTHMLHHLIHAAYENGTPEPVVTPVAVPAPIVAPPVAQVRAANPSGLPSLPPPTIITQPSASPSAIPGMPDVNIQPGVANVIITAQGTKVISPSGVTTTVGPGEHVGLEASMSTPPMPFSEPGVQTIVLPPGGGMTPETIAALSPFTGKPVE